MYFVDYNRYIHNLLFSIHQRYIFESKSQRVLISLVIGTVVFNTSKIHFWEQITTQGKWSQESTRLFSIHQRYMFESKSQQLRLQIFSHRCCFQYIKDTFLRANHNTQESVVKFLKVVFNTSKIHFWEQITTERRWLVNKIQLFSIHQRYIFESKSQQVVNNDDDLKSCFQYIKDTFLRANHNIYKYLYTNIMLFSIHQRYIFESKSQR